MKKNKFLIILLAVVSVLCLILGVACNKKEDELKHTVTFEAAEGVHYVSDVKDGARVSDGFVLVFSVSIDQGYDGILEVYLNKDYSNPIKPNDDLEYTVTVTQDIEISVGGIQPPITSRRFDVTFTVGTDEDGAENWFHYYINGEEVSDQTISVRGGDEVSFTVKASSYYDPDCDIRILANTQRLIEENGVYTFTVRQKTNITVSGLVLEDNFIAREEGTGTAANPYRIRRPIDLYVMATLINNSYYANSSYRYDYYRLEADIDMEGERLFVIGSAENDTAVFAGNFDGNGHSISNYYISNVEINQSTFAESYIYQVGLFGYCVATVSAPAEIYNLTLKDFTIEAVAKTLNENEIPPIVFVGGVVGYGVGVNITACNVSGSITVQGADTHLSYVGGIIGWQQAASDGVSVNFMSYVRACSTDVEIACESGLVRAAGGISGALLSYDDKTPALILQCYSTGDVYGALATGGIAGLVGDFAGIAECYATGSIEAYCSISPMGDLASELAFCYATAGGIVGVLGMDTAVTGSFFTGSLSASAAGGSSYTMTDGIVAKITDERLITSCEPAIVGNYSSARTVYGTQRSITNSFIQSEMGWDSLDWHFTGNLPSLNLDAAETKKVNVTVVYPGASKTSVSEISYGTVSYAPMAYWYAQTNSPVAEFITDGNLRSYGYYFDAALTVRVPVGYLVTNDVTIYVGFADYSEVAGTYYLVSADHREIALTLFANGVVTYTDGAREYSSDYYYTGKEIVLRRQNFMYLSGLQPGEINEYYFSDYNLLAEVSDGKIEIYDTMFFTNSHLFGAKEISGFAYGEYAVGSETYDFRYDGYVRVLGQYWDTYTVEGNTVRFGNSTATLTGGSVTAIDGKSTTAVDAFKGVWIYQTTGGFMELTIDGYGAWSYLEYYYNNTGDKVTVDSSVKQGTYTRSGSEITLLSGSANFATVQASDNGMKVTLASKGKAYAFGLEGGIAGVWQFSRTTDYDGHIIFELSGLNKDGVGTGTMNSSSGIFDVKYSILNGEIVIFNGGDQVAQLVFNRNAYTLTGLVLSGGTITSDAIFCRFDDLAGDWILNGSNFTAINIDGFGLYDIAGNTMLLTVNGDVVLTLAGGGTVTVDYDIDRENNRGVFEYNNVTYYITLNPNDTLSLQASSTQTLYRYDSFKDITLRGEDGEYTFDGRSTLGRGVLTTPSGTTYSYTVNGSGLTLYPNAQSSSSCGSLTVNANGYYNLTISGSSETLYVVNKFTGVWRFMQFVNGEMVEYDFTVGELNVSNNTFSGTFDGETKTYSYLTQSGVSYLSFEYNDQTMYLYSLQFGGLLLSYRNDINLATVKVVSDEDIICLETDKLDGYYGEYTSDNGATLRLDGFSTSTYGDASAIYKSDSETVYFSYSRRTNKAISEYEYLLLSASTGEYWVLVRAPFSVAGEATFVINGESYVLARQDFVYSLRALLTVYDAQDKREIYTVFSFNGFGLFEGYDYDRVSSDELIYSGTYEIEEINEAAGTVTLRLYDEIGRDKELIITINYWTATVITFQVAD